MPDPRSHPFVESWNGNKITYKCKCVNNIDHRSGILRSTVKCPTHRAAMRDPRGLDAAYYSGIGVLEGDRLQETAHVAELTAALGPIPPAREPGAVALEVGAGLSPYIPSLLAAGYRYVGVEPSRWAAGWARRAHGVEVIEDDFERASLPRCAFLLAAHSIEHMADSARAIRRCAELLMTGGEAWIVVPDDEDPVNPDHLSHHTPASLLWAIEAAGLRVDRLVSERIVAHERFLYCKATKL